MAQLATVLAIVSVVSGVLAQRPECHNRGAYELLAKADCSGYYICVNTEAIEMPDCPAGSVFSNSAHVCVPKGSYYDDCQPGSGHEEHVGSVDMLGRPPKLPDLGPLTVEEQCQMGSGLMAHPDECQAYYNCSHKYDEVPSYYEQFQMECPYPQLFNARTLKCEHFENVHCETRKESRNGCDYKRNQCPIAHCIPCYIRFPSCETLNDGLNPHTSKPWSPYFITCYKGRMVGEQICPADKDGRTQLFHPDLKECAPLDMIPQEHGGMMPSCRGKPDGFYPDDFGRCGQYTACEGGKFLNFVRCRTGEVYDDKLEVCMKIDEACGACGRKTNC